MKNKICTKCKIAKQLDQFGKQKRAVNGRGSWCKACIAKGVQCYKKKKCTKKLQVVLPTGRKRNIYAKDINLQKLMQYCNDNGIDTKLILTEPSKHNTPQFIQLGIKQKQKTIKAKRNKIEKAKYRRDHKEELHAKQKERYKQNSKQISAQHVIANRKRTAHKAGVDENFTATKEAFVRRFWDDCCAICGKTQEEEKKRKLQLDHWFPLSKGHALTVSNAVLMCKSCNCKKHDRYPKDVFDSATLMWVESKIREQARQWHKSRKVKCGQEN